jgi:hypothetical protein
MHPQSVIKEKDMIDLPAIDMHDDEDKIIGQMNEMLQ